MDLPIKNDWISMMKIIKMAAEATSPNLTGLVVDSGEGLAPTGDGKMRHVLPIYGGFLLKWRGNPKNIKKPWVLRTIPPGNLHRWWFNWM